LIAVYFRLTIPETPRFTIDVEGDYNKGLQDANAYVANTKDNSIKESNPSSDVKERKTCCNDFFNYFGKWANFKVLLGCSLAWFFVDIGYYGTNLNTSIVLTAINYSDNSTPFNYVWSLSVGTCIIALCGNVPGFYFTVFLVDKLGRKTIQIIGFTMLIICFLILATAFNPLKTNAIGAFVVIYALAQFFFNFGPNTTTFMIPAEVFPTHLRTTGHGISAASGKAGAILASQAFSLIANINGKNASITTDLGIFTGACFLGLLSTFLVPETKNMSLEELGVDRNIEEDKNLELKNIQIEVKNFEPENNNKENVCENSKLKEESEVPSKLISGQTLPGVNIKKE